MPIRFVIKSRRVMFWWHLVNLDKKELLHKFYVAQKMNTNKGDWVEQLEKDKKELNLDWSDDEIKTFSKEQFRRVVKQKTEIFAANHLEGVKKSKTENIRFDGFKPAQYLMSNNLTNDEVQTLFKLRTRMIDVKENFKTANNDNLWCIVCHIFSETQQHLMN